MRLGAKMMLWACCAGPAVAAMLVTGSGSANAAALKPAAGAVASLSPSSGNGPQGGPGQFGNNQRRASCSRWQREKWNLNGTSTVVAVYHTTNFTYDVSFQQNGSCLGGTLTDPYIPSPGPKSGPISGTVNGNQVTFSFTYTYPNAPQGTRTFTGTISRSGAVSGTWGETGPEAASGTWSLGTRAARACPRFWWWNPRHECFVRA